MSVASVQSSPKEWKLLKILCNLSARQVVFALKEAPLETRWRGNMKEGVLGD
jgi:hypothetical protein